MSELLQFIIVAAFGGLCFGCGYLTGFIVTRNHWRDEMIKRGVARYVTMQRSSEFSTRDFGGAVRFVACVGAAVW